jgi:putative intracellular protease/amidase
MLASWWTSFRPTVGLEEVVPYLLASTLVSRGALHEPVENFQPQVVVDGRLVTGQNPASADGVAQAVVQQLCAVEVGTEVRS